MFLTNPTRLLVLAVLASLPFSFALASDKYKAPPRPDDPVNPIPESPHYAGWGYVCSISSKKPNIVTASFETSPGCEGYSEMYVYLCSAEALDELHCPESADPDYADHLYNDIRLQLTVDMLRDAMTSRSWVQVYRSEYYGYQPDYNGDITYGHRIQVNFN